MANAPLVITPLNHDTSSDIQRTKQSPFSLASRKQKLNMNHAPRSSQLSGSTAYAGSSSSLNTLSTAVPAVPQNGGPVVATSNIMNQKADASRSLYQMCVALKQRLAQVPNFESYSQQLDPYDPVDPLWDLLRTGLPLLTIYNATNPAKPLDVDDPAISDVKKPKIAIFRFVQACMKELKMSPGGTFVITDLMGNDTSGFVKVIQVVNHVLDLAEQGGNLLQLQPYPEDDHQENRVGAQMTYRDHIVKELVDTERKYVQDLENLHDLKKTLEQRGAIPGDIIHSIFLNINAILDFQRRFLIRVETMNSMPAPSQRWGSPFVIYEESFSIYQPFIANQRKAALLANQVFDQIQTINHPVALDFNTLDAFLLKPMSRLVKYPLLLKDLNKKSEDQLIKDDLTTGCDAAERVLHKANDAVHSDLLEEAWDDLLKRVDSWKSHKVETFGRLLLHGVYGVITGKSDQEKDYEIYLFETILLCCKEVNVNKSKDKKDKTRSTGPRTKNKNAKLHLKGRIFMNAVSDILSISKPGSHTVQIWWKGDPGIENFTIRFLTEEEMRKWAHGLEVQRKDNAPRISQNPDGIAPVFNWNAQVGNGLENPYLEQDEEDEDDYETSASDFPVPRNGSQSMPRTSSSSNLLQRSQTNDSISSFGRPQPSPPRGFPLPTPPAALSLQTNGSSSPGPRIPADSYFSPTENSPASSRTSAASGMFVGYPFPKSGTPQSGWEDGRRNPRGPSLPAMATNQTSTLQQQRSRSYSTPDINAPTGPRQSQPTPTNGVPSVPSIPQHLTNAHDASAAPRSQTASPRNDMPIRSHTQSPGAQREHLHQPSNSLGGNLAHYSPGPIHSRGNTPGSQSSVHAPLRVDSISANSRPVSPGAPTNSSYLTASTPALSNHKVPSSSDPPLPTQLKVRVNCDSGNYVTLVVAFNITYQSLVDRIDAKLARFTNSSIGKSMLKLRYQDEDGDFVTILSDEDIQIAFSEYREGLRNMYSGGVGEIELFCVGDVSGQ